MATPPSTRSIPATIGPPKSAEIAENSPAAESTAEPRRPMEATRAARTPTSDPSATIGASGPSTAPNESVPSAASATPGP